MPLRYAQEVKFLVHIRIIRRVLEKCEEALQRVPLDSWPVFGGWEFLDPDATAQVPLAVEPEDGFENEGDDRDSDDEDADDESTVPAPANVSVPVSPTSRAVPRLLPKLLLLPPSSHPSQRRRSPPPPPPPRLPQTLLPRMPPQRRSQHRRPLELRRSQPWVALPPPPSQPALSLAHHPSCSRQQRSRRRQQRTAMAMRRRAVTIAITPATTAATAAITTATRRTVATRQHLERRRQRQPALALQRALALVASPQQLRSRRRMTFTPNTAGTRTPILTLAIQRRRPLLPLFPRRLSLAVQHCSEVLWVR